ncbi:hypothetical protein YTPLAS18_08560 [Nitrospira sp.]|nr:hypothetical protein YTPLAS18_08560 [Nitrospira sp.]
MKSCTRGPILFATLALAVLVHISPAATGPPIDLTGTVAVIATYISRDIFTSEYQYEVSVRNVGTDVIAGDSLLLVVDRVMNVAGEDREPLKHEPLLNRMEVLGADGETAEGKPFFRLTVEGGQDLLPQTDSRPVRVVLRNRDYVQVFTPAFRVMGSRRPPPPPARLREPLLTTPGPKAPRATQQQPIDTLIQLLIKKGVLTEEEWRAANTPTP